MPTLEKEIIEAAISGLEGRKQHIDQQIAELRGMLKGGSTAKGHRGGKRKFSPEAIERMREAQQRRWAKVRGAGATTKTAAKPKTKRKLSAAARRSIAGAQKKRWAAKKAESGQ